MKHMCPHPAKFLERSSGASLDVAAFSLVFRRLRAFWLAVWSLGAQNFFDTRYGHT